MSRSFLISFISGGLVALAVLALQLSAAPAPQHIVMGAEHAVWHGSSSPAVIFAGSACPYVQKKDRAEGSSCPYMAKRSAERDCPYDGGSAEADAKCPYMSGATECPHSSRSGTPTAWRTKASSKRTEYSANETQPM